MTAKECKDQLMSSNPFMRGCRNIDKFNDYINSLLEILEKQIPQKPKIVEVEMDGMDMETGEECTYKMDDAHCINCDSVIGNKYDRFNEHYCDKCGQRIDWSCWE